MMMMPYNDPYRNPKKITADELLMDKIEKMKQEITNEERYKFKIYSNTPAREVLRMFQGIFDKMGIEIEILQDMSIASMEFRHFHGMEADFDVLIRRISDQNLRRIIEIEERDLRFREKIKAEIIEEMKKENAAREEAEKNRQKANTDNRAKTLLSLINNETKRTPPINTKDMRKLVKKSDGTFDWSEGKSFEETRNENKSTEYQEKIKWFCEKYNENYDIIFESFKNDDLDNLFWKGEKVEFPKK